MYGDHIKIEGPHQYIWIKFPSKCILKKSLCKIVKKRRKFLYNNYNYNSIVAFAKSYHNNTFFPFLYRDKVKKPDKKIIGSSSTHRVKRGLDVCIYNWIIFILKGV